MIWVLILHTRLVYISSRALATDSFLYTVRLCVIFAPLLLSNEVHCTNFAYFFLLYKLFLNYNIILNDVKHFTDIENQ